MRIRNLIAVVLIALSSPASAQFTKSTLSSQVSTSFPDYSVGAITPATTRTFLNNLITSYQQFSGVNAQVGTTYALALSDYGQLVTFNNSSPIAVSLAQANASFTTWNAFLVNQGSGTLTITPTASTICGSSTLVLKQNQSVWIVSDNTNYQCLFSLGGVQVTYPLSVANGGTNGGVASGTLLDNITGFNSLGFLTRTGVGTYAFQSFTNGITTSNLAQALANTTLCNATSGTANITDCNGGTLSANLCQPNKQVFLTGTDATYTTPTCNSVLPTYIEWKLIGGGGGGGGSGTAPAAATAGTASCVKASGTACSSPLFSANGGALGPTASAAFAAGGTTTGCDSDSVTGGNGGSGGNSTSANGANGGISSLGGAGGVINNGAGSVGGAAIANTGSGGGGAPAIGAGGSGGGGGAGGTCFKLLTSPAASYVYTVGSAGNAGGAGGTGEAGGAGSAGQLSAIAHWQ